MMAIKGRLREAALQRRGRHALPARMLTQSSRIAPSSRAGTSGVFSPRNPAARTRGGLASERRDAAASS
jgi:hypothetical protein